MKLNQLRYFQVVGELSSITRASARLRIAQPALTRHIKELEYELGVRLVEKAGRGIVLTEPGRQFMQRISRILQDIDSLSFDLKATMRRSQPLRIGIPTALCGVISGHLIDAMRHSCDAEIQVVDGWSGFIAHWLESGRLDLGIIYDNVRGNENLVTEPLALERQYLICRRTDARARQASVTLKEVAELPLVLPSEEHGLRRFLDTHLATWSMRVSPAMEIDSMVTIKTILQESTSAPLYSVMSESEVVHGFPAQLAAVVIDGPALNRTLYLAWARGRTSQRLTSETLETVRRSLSDMIDARQWGASYIGAPFAQSGHLRPALQPVRGGAIADRFDMNLN